MQKQACFDGQGQIEPINNHEASENPEQTCVPNMSYINQVIKFHHHCIISTDHKSTPDKQFFYETLQEVCNKTG